MTNQCDVRAGILSNAVKRNSSGAPRSCESPEASQFQGYVLALRMPTCSVMKENNGKNGTTNRLPQSATS